LRTRKSTGAKQEQGKAVRAASTLSLQPDPSIVLPTVTTDCTVPCLVVSVAPRKKRGTFQFEPGLCNFENTGTASWLRGQGPTPTGSTGPDNDHTLGNGAGSYLFVEANSNSGKQMALTLDLGNPYVETSK
jgi:hypothetical protein